MCHRSMVSMSAVWVWCVGGQRHGCCRPSVCDGCRPYPVAFAQMLDFFKTFGELYPCTECSGHFRYD